MISQSLSLLIAKSCYSKFVEIIVFFKECRNAVVFRVVAQKKMIIDILTYIYIVQLQFKKALKERHIINFHETISKRKK
jgi:hypothetical protein